MIWRPRKAVILRRHVVSMRANLGLARGFDRESITRGLARGSPVAWFAMPKEQVWPAVEELSWFTVHQSIRKDLDEMKAALTRMSRAKQLEAWEIPTLKKWWHAFADFVHGHHGIEDAYFFPAFSKRFELPSALGPAHETVDWHMLVIGTAIDACTEQAGIPFILEAFVKFDKFFRPHLREEERAVLPNVQKKFTYAEWQKIEHSFQSKLQWYDPGHMWRTFGDDMARKRQHGIQILGIPPVVFDNVIKKRVERFTVEHDYLLLELVDPSLKPKHDEHRKRFMKGAGKAGPCVVM